MSIINNEDDNNDAITFLLDEENGDKNNEDNIKKIMDEFNKDIEFEQVNTSWLTHSGETDIDYILHKSNYQNDELFYEQEYTVKDLLKICNYYGLDKDIKTSKCKKQDIIATIIYFESLPENFEIVHKRNKMWTYIIELLNDPKMKKYVIF